MAVSVPLRRGLGAFVSSYHDVVEHSAGVGVHTFDVRTRGLFLCFDFAGFRLERPPL